MKHRFLSNSVIAMSCGHMMFTMTMAGVFATGRVKGLLLLLHDFVPDMNLIFDMASGGLMFCTPFIY